MARLTKEQRRQKRKRQRAEQRKRRATKVLQKPWVVPKMKLFQMPEFLPAEVPREKRIEILRNIGAQAQSVFDEKYLTIAEWFKDYDALYVLSYCCFNYLSFREGIDPEASGSLDFYYHYLEIMQAFALRSPRAYTPKPLLHHGERLRQEMKELGEAMQLRGLANTPDSLASESDLHAHQLRHSMIAQTTAVRNWAYPEQIRRIVLSLAATVSKQFKEKYGISPEELMQMIFELVEQRNDLLNEHLVRLRSFASKKTRDEILAAYTMAFPDTRPLDASQAFELWERAGQKPRNLVAMLLTHADLRLEDIYSFTVADALSCLEVEISADELQKILDSLSFRFGDLKDFPPEHIILGNPVLRRPFIKVDETKYFSAVWGVLYHAALEILEDLIWSDEELRKTYSDKKADFLENEVERIFKEGFPNAQVFRGSLWTDPGSGVGYENDLIVVIDSFAIVVEAKSGGVSDPARRGAPKTLFSTLRRLVEEPSDQALRFIDYLQSHPRVHVFSTNRGQTHTVDSSSIRYFIPLGVTFSHLGMLGSNLKRLINAKVVDKRLEELAPSMSVTDLEDVFRLLTSESLKVHYLARRREFEAHMDYEGDELDLLAFYLDNGFNIGDAEYSKRIVLNISMKSKELDPYFVGAALGKSVAKPELSMTQWWKDLLQAVANRRSPGWMETAFILLNVTKDDQVKFEKMFKELADKVMDGAAPHDHNWVLCSSGPERRRYLIGGYPYITSDIDVRNGVINSILADKSFGTVRGAAVIGVNVGRMDYPYSVIAREAATTLFDVLTLEPETG